MKQQIKENQIARREYVWNREGVHEIRIETCSLDLFTKIQFLVERLVKIIEEE